MRSARRNIGERSANPSSSPAAAGGPDDRWRMEAAGEGSTRSPSVSVQRAVSHSRWRHSGSHIIAFRTCYECAELRLGVPGVGVDKLCKWLIDKPLEPPNADRKSACRWFDS